MSSPVNRAGAPAATEIIGKSDLGYLTDIALFTDDFSELIYFFADGYVWHVSTSGDNAYGTLVTGYEPMSLATDNKAVYGAAFSANAVVAYSYGAVPVVIADNEASPTRIITDGTNLYWINSGDQTIRQKAIACEYPFHE